MILKVLEWQTETSFCTIRIRGKQWYWIYKISLNNKTLQNNKQTLIGSKNINNVYVNKYTIDTFFFKKKFLKKVNFLENNRLLKKKFIFFNKQNINILNFYLKKNNVFFLKNNYNFDFFFTLKKNTNVLKKFNRVWLTTQQQSKTDLNTVFNINIFFNKKIVFYKNINNFIKNNILVKNRLISVDNIIYLPSRKNITVITNSFDVAHSWFVPGLGLKFDCIPGRSTHNSLFISKPGYYFGHCAEVCGRFHHHMPIKIIALNVDHFIYYYNISTNIHKKTK